MSKNRSSRSNYNSYPRKNRTVPKNIPNKRIGDKILDMPIFDPKMRAENHYGRNWVIVILGIYATWMAAGGLVNYVEQQNTNPFNTKTDLTTVTVGSPDNPPFTPQGLIDEEYPPSIYYNGNDNDYLNQFIQNQTKNGSDVLNPGQSINLPTRFSNGQPIPMNKQNIAVNNSSLRNYSNVRTGRRS